MKKLVISEFKAKCIAVLREAEETGEPVLVTRRGRPVARVEPVGAEEGRKQLGALKGTLRIRRDLARSDTTRDWDMLE
ncbi:MAG TPA: type II toxin-antitoxin system Phd/YefM family antitoxin [Candidatus Binatia bacterium]|nr:type II toxin-antitoxin system Phd/YefM family antitoxin [Candidatus Binatia bacterium]